MQKLSAAMLLVCALPALASPPPPRIVDVPLAQAPVMPEIDQAQEQIESAEFEEAVKTLQQALNAPDVSDDQLVEIYRLLGLAYLYLGNEDKAREAFEKLLQARPDFEIDKRAPPKVRALYARIKEDIKKRRLRPVTITTEPIPDVAGGEPLEVTARIQDLALGSKPKLYYRRAGQQSYSSVDFTRDRKDKELFHATVPSFELPAEASEYQVEYYLEVADAAQRRLAGRGDAFSPQRLTVKGQGAAPVPGGGDPDRWYHNPWVWVGVGVVAAGAGVGVYFLASQQPTGSIRVNINYPP